MKTKSEIPKEWFIIITDENRYIVNQWKKTTRWNRDLFDALHYTSVSMDGAGGVSNPSFDELTTEEFEQYIYKDLYEDEFESNERLVELLNQKGVI